jgi:glutathione synthase/RimK-type ligase-like ATP-grasp enzyme
MKKVLVLFGKKDWKENSWKEEDKYKRCYEYMYDMAKENGIQMYRASYTWYDSQNKLFKFAWSYQNKSWIRAENIKPDLVYDKTKFSTEVHCIKETIAKNYRVLNHPEFTMVANNKLFTSWIFPEFFKKYYKVFKQEQLIKILDKLRTKKVVIKPTYGSGGANVEIIDKTKARRLNIQDPVIVQEFIDSSGGISGICQSLHDLRLVFVDDKLIYSYIREPKKGLLLANVALGGTMTIVKPENLPKSLDPIIEKVSKTFSFYNPKIFTIDLIFDKNQRPWIVELNTMPGIYFTPDQYKWRDKFYLAVISLLNKF